VKFTGLVFKRRRFTILYKSRRLIFFLRRKRTRTKRTRFIKDCVKERE
jgi:hypothetical protein